MVKNYFAFAVPPHILCPYFSWGLSNYRSLYIMNINATAKNSAVWKLKFFFFNLPLDYWQMASGIFCYTKFSNFYVANFIL